MNLYDKLKPEVKEAMLADETNYPNLVNHIVENLKTEDTVPHLTFMTVRNLCSYANKEVSEINLYNLFN